MSKKAIVTGASRGIGKGIAMCLAAEGYDLAISYASKKEEAEKVAEQIRHRPTAGTVCSSVGLYGTREKQRSRRGADGDLDGRYGRKSLSQNNAGRENCGSAVL